MKTKTELYYLYCKLDKILGPPCQLVIFQTNCSLSFYMKQKGFKPNNVRK